MAANYYTSKIESTRAYYVDGRAAYMSTLKPKSVDICEGPNTPVASGARVNPDTSGT